MLRDLLIGLVLYSFAQQGNGFGVINRRELIGGGAAFFGGLLVSNDISNAEDQQVWLSGKSQVVKSDKSDRTGTKRDSKFLRCLSGCLSSCDAPGAGKDRSSCLKECQDGCCFTYEQCSATLNPSMV